MGFKVYDADQVSITIAGVPIIAGFADGEFLRIERETEAFSDVVGTDGEVTRSKSNDDRATITVILMQTADSNDLLAALHRNDKRTPGGAGVGRTLIEDLNGRALYEARKSWIMTSPDASFDREATSREWAIRVEKLEDFTGGT